MKTIAFFNNKGGVGKTSLVYHLAWMFADRGKRVLAVDLDPQANLSSMFLEDTRLEEIWDDDSGRSIIHSLRPLIEGEGAPIPYVENVTGNLGLIVGNLALSRFEDQLSYNWGRCLESEILAFRFVTSFYKVILDASQVLSADIVFVDVGPNLGAINRSAMITTDSVILPLAADMFSIQGMKNLGPTLSIWREGWLERLKKADQIKFPLPQGRMLPAGYVVTQHGVREGRPVKAYRKWVDRIPGTYRSYVLGAPVSAPDVLVESDPYNLALLKHYRSLMPMAQESRKPIFHLTPADGAIGAHYEAVQECYRDFLKLAKRIAAVTDITID
jgi:chromosome partitioning protein